MARDWDPVQRSKYNKCGKSRDTSGDRSHEPRVKSRVETKVATVQCSMGLGYRGSGRQRARVTTSFISHFIFLDEVATATIAADFPQLGQSQPHLMATSHMLCHMSRHSHASCHMSHVTPIT